MHVSVQFLSFFVIQTDDEGGQSGKRYKHYQTLNREQYEDSELKPFLSEEFVRICKRKVEKNPSSESVPTKIGRFIVEPGHELTSNPNYNLLQRIRFAEDKTVFLGFADELLRMYMETSAVRGGAFIAAQAKLPDLFDDPFLFVMKCDFEPKIARISDETSLVSQVEMAISARSIKSIQYPYMPEPGMLEEWELKIHQASHARYFEDFLKFVTYEKPMPTIITEHVFQMVQDYMEEKWQAAPEYAAEHRQQDEQAIELWACSDKRDLQQRWTHEQVVEATAQIMTHKEDLELKFKLDHISIKGMMADYGDKVHIASLNGRYVVLIEGDSFQFDKGFTPIELLHPEPFEQVAARLAAKKPSPEERYTDDRSRESPSSAEEGLSEASPFKSPDPEAPPWD
ncbi:DUF3900 domain-containing protein [Paenibacillus sp. y28]|uniref:DUF3900 domain-containing protein n=1 Tax=Paenibacillus sp. y28 TaxID=3129110 RepID=UPI003018B798